MPTTPRLGPHEFGGDWTTQKLAVLGGYLAAYTRALQRQAFRKTYIDAFAGTGSRDSRRSADQAPLFPDMEADILDGSARAALQSLPHFDDFVFIEQSQKRCAELERWYDEFYRVEHDTDLFGDQRDHLVKASMASIGGYFTRRLGEVFAGVAKPGVLRNSVSNPMYLLCFAVGNPRGRDIGLRIAGHLLKGMH